MTHEEKTDLIRELRSEVNRLKAELREYQQQGVGDLLAEIERLETVINSRSYHDGVSAQAEIARLKALLGRAADALENKQWNVVSREDLDLIAELRKAAQ